MTSSPVSSVQWMPFNINTSVRVKLTAKGITELRQRAEQLRKDFPNLQEFDPIKLDSDGYSKMQLWVLMEALGHLCHLGCAPPFETEILIEVTK